MDKEGLFACACAAAFSLALLPANGWAQTGTITGTLTDASTGAPIPNMAVEIYVPFFQRKSPREDRLATVVTDANGVYQVPGLWDGFYRVGTNPSGRYAAQRFNNFECVRVCSPFGGTTVSVTGSAPASGIDFALYPTGAADVVAALGPEHGLWMLAADGTRQQLHGLSPRALTTGDLDGNHQDDLIVDFGPGVTPRLTAAGYLSGGHTADLVLDFGEPYGIWTWRKVVSAWSQIHQASARSIVLADRTANAVDEIMIDFGPPHGLWQIANNDAAAWSQLDALSPEAIVVGQFH